MGLARNILLAMSTNAWLREKATKAAFVRRSVSKFMPGETVDDAIAAAKIEEAQGIDTIFTKLGENVSSEAEARGVMDHYLEVLDKVHAAGLHTQISVKPTQLGLDLDEELSFRLTEAIVKRAEQTGNFVWIDMESSPYVDRTIAQYRRLREGSRIVGICLQAYLYRTEKDIEDLIPGGAAVRLVKGAYLEPADVAFPKKADVDENYFKLCCRLMSDEAQSLGAVLHMGTHDPVLAGRLNAWADQHKVPRTAYEFAMLYGIQRGLQLRLNQDQRRLRVLIAYGEYWFPWYMRRLAERPANVGFVIKNLFS